MILDTRWPARAWSRTSDPLKISTARHYLGRLKDFIGAGQRYAIATALQGEEGEAIAAIVLELYERIRTMPKTYESRGVKDPIAHLHYFGGNYDAWITEKDAGDPREPADTAQRQAFGAARFPELEIGYVPIFELIRNGIEIDLYWRPRPLSECGKDGA